MGVAEDRPGFLGRWARRKNDVLQGKPLDEPGVPLDKVPVPASSASVAPANALPEAAPVAETPAPEKLLSLDDVKLLTQESDFRPFMARNVGPEIRNAAMKKLFTDPHYNVMDGLDIYISDYSIADPIPESMLRQMVGAKLLKIFDDEDDEADENPALAREGTPALPVVTDRQVIDAPDDAQATSILPADATSVHGVPPEPGVVPAMALSARQEAGQQEDLFIGAADSSAECIQVATQPRT